jgi:cation diffusion facilitator CzcD-associated flavoprotein CzcO
MSAKLGHEPRLVDKIIPKSFDVGCRRPSPGPGYLEALIAPNTTVYTDTIHEITSRGFCDPDGHEVDVDVIICATGFDTSFRPRFPIIGLDGVDLRDMWKE